MQLEIAYDRKKKKPKYRVLTGTYYDTFKKWTTVDRIIGDCLINMTGGAFHSKCIIEVSEIEDHGIILELKK